MVASSRNVYSQLEREPIITGRWITQPTTWMPRKLIAGFKLAVLVCTCTRTGFETLLLRPISSSSGVSPSVSVSYSHSVVHKDDDSKHDHSRHRRTNRSVFLEVVDFPPRACKLQRRTKIADSRMAEVTRVSGCCPLRVTSLRADKKKKSTNTNPPW